MNLPVSRWPRSHLAREPGSRNPGAFPRLLLPRDIGRRTCPKEICATISLISTRKARSQFGRTATPYLPPNIYLLRPFSRYVPNYCARVFNPARRPFSFAICMYSVHILLPLFPQRAMMFTSSRGSSRSFPPPPPRAPRFIRPHRLTVKILISRAPPIRRRARISGRLSASSGFTRWDLGVTQF